MKPYYETELGKLYHGDCLEIMPQLEPVDLVLTDPPWGINGSSGTINRNRNKGNYKSNFVDDESNIVNHVVPAIKIAISLSVACIVTPGNKYLGYYPNCDSFGCFYQPAACGLQTFGFGDSQPILYYGKNPTKKNLGKPCSYLVTEKPSTKEHPCAKPFKPWSLILQNMSLEGQIVLDPFIGSGTTAIACEKYKRRWIGIEIEEKYCEVAAKRIENERKQLKLF